MFPKECPMYFVYELYKATGKQVYHAIWAEAQRELSWERQYMSGPRFW